MRSPYIDSIPASNDQDNDVQKVSNPDGSPIGSIDISEVASSSSVGGGNNIWSNTAGDFVATANAGVKTITLSSYASAVLSASLNNNNFLNAVIKRRNSTGHVDSLPTTNISFSANVLTLSDMDATFVAGDTVAVFLQGPDKGYDETNDLMKFQANAGTNLNTSALALEAGGNLATISTTITALAKAEDAAHASGDKGIMFFAVRRDANTTLVDSDGDYGPPQLTSDGSLKVAITAGAGTGGTSQADKAAFTEGTTSLTPIGGLYVSSASTLTSGTIAAIALDVNRNVMTHEQYGPVAEDNANGVIATVHKTVVSSTYSSTAFTNYGAAFKANVKNAAAQLKSITAHNKNAAARYLQIFNLTASPTDDSSVPIFSFFLPAGTATNPGIREIGQDFFGTQGYYLSTGLSWGISVDAGVFNETGVTASEHQINGTYK